MRLRHIVLGGIVCSLLIGLAVYAAGSHTLFDNALAPSGVPLKNVQPGLDGKAPFNNVKAAPYFATGDGVVNDTTAVTNAFADALGTEIVALPCPGSYKTTTWGTLTCGDYYPPLATTGSFPRSVPAKLLDAITIRDFGAVADGTTDNSAAFANALNSFGAAPACGVINLPRGVYAVASMVDVNNREGCIFQGAGVGQTDATCSTTIKWTGAANGTVFRVFSTRWSKFQDFCIDGNATAGIGISLTATNTPAPSQQDHFTNIQIQGVGGSPGYNFYIGSATNQQVSECTFDNITCFGGVSCYFHEGNQTIDNLIRGGLVSAPTSIGLDIEGGSMETQDMDFENGNGSTDVKVAGSGNVGRVVFYDNYHEDIGNSAAVAYSLPAGTGRTGPTLWFGGEILYTSATGGTVIDYAQEGPVVMSGTLFTGNAPGQGGTINFHGAGPSPSITSLFGVAFYQSNVLACSGTSTCTWDGGGALNGSAASTQFRNQSTSVWGGASVLCDSAGANCYRILSNSTQLRFIDTGGTNILGGFAADTATVTGTWSAAKLRVGTGVSADAGGFKHLRTTAGCATAASVGATCDTTVTWTTTFADANETPVCEGFGITSGVPVSGGMVSKLAASVVFRTVAMTAAAAQYTNIYCHTVHD